MNSKTKDRVRRHPEFEKDYSKLTFANDFIFAKVMRNKTLCKKLLEVILHIEIKELEYVEEQKAIDEKADAKSVRLDVYVNDDKETVYNIEMQTTNTRNLPKRSRYYQGIIDVSLIKKGEDYRKLNKCFVIFICTFDVFGEGRHIYTFENRCRENMELALGDDTVKVFLNAGSNMDDVDEELGNFLKYLIDGMPQDRFTEDIAEEVKKVKSDKELEVEYMTMLMREMEKYEEGREEGREEEKAKVFVKCLKRGFNKQEAMDFSEIGQEAADGLYSEFMAQKQLFP